MLKMKDVCKIYRTDTVETHALRGFSLAVEDGEFVSVTGPSGSGKTTFLNIAGLLEELTSGIYELDVRDISALEALFQDLEKRNIPVRGILHAAGVNWFSKIMDLELEAWHPDDVAGVDGCRF